MKKNLVIILISIFIISCSSTQTRSSKKTAYKSNEKLVSLYEKNVIQSCQLAPLAGFLQINRAFKNFLFII